MGFFDAEKNIMQISFFLLNNLVNVYTISLNKMINIFLKIYLFLKFYIVCKNTYFLTIPQKSFFFLKSSVGSLPESNKFNFDVLD